MRAFLSLVTLAIAASAAAVDIDVVYSKRAPTPGTLGELHAGNARFRQKVDPDLMDELKDGQHPPFLYLGCVDSRVSEGTIFDAPPGRLFTTRNIANQYHSDDVTSSSTIAYGVEHLHVKHIIVTGHYGCGGVSAAITSAHTEPPSSKVKRSEHGEEVIDEWIAPIRDLYLSSTRTEIVAMRAEYAAMSPVTPPGLHHAGFRALVEENVKASVNRLAADTLLANHGGGNGNGNVLPGDEPPQPVFIHGWVYDIENGQIHDLNVSVGPF